MKEGKKIPRWPLYLADALMFVTVFVVAMPSISYMERMPFGETMLCCLLVLCGMCLTLVPYLLDYKASENKKDDSDEEDTTKRDLEIIFTELEALRSMLLEAEEKREASELNAQNLEDKLALFEAGVTELRSSIQKHIKELGDSIELVSKHATDNSTDISKQEEFSSTLDAQLTILKEESNFLKSEFENFKSDALSTRKSLKGAFDKLSQKLSDFASETEQEPAQNISTPSAESMLSKALSNSDNIKDSVNKFIERSKVPELPQAQEEAQTIPEENQFDGGNIEASEDNSDFFEPSDSDVSQAESEIIVEAKPEPKEELPLQEETPLLFDELPESLKKINRLKKGDTVIILDALVGIGNKPFVRGEGSEELSWDKGIPMEFVEIGKWRLVLNSVKDVAKIKFYKNDTLPSTDDDIYEIEAGDKLDFNVQFPADQ